MKTNNNPDAIPSNFPVVARPALCYLSESKGFGFSPNNAFWEEIPNSGVACIQEIPNSGVACIQEIPNSGVAYIQGNPKFQTYLTHTHIPRTGSLSRTIGAGDKFRQCLVNIDIQLNKQ